MTAQSYSTTNPLPQPPTTALLHLRAAFAELWRPEARTEKRFSTISAPMVLAGKALFHMRLVDCANDILHGERDEYIEHHWKCKSTAGFCSGFNLSAQSSPARTPLIYYHRHIRGEGFLLRNTSQPRNMQYGRT